MKNKRILKNPITIKLGKYSNKILVPENDKIIEYPLLPGAMFYGIHYGFIVINDNTKYQTETIYPTQNNIIGIAIKNGELQVFEDGKQTPWLFDHLGQLIQNENDYTKDYQDNQRYIAENNNLFLNKPTIKNPIKIKLSENIQECKISSDKKISQEYPLHPGVLMDTVSYGFTIIVNTPEGEKETTYPTQNKIDAVTISERSINLEEPKRSPLKIFEDGKYIPWTFTYQGELINEAQFNPRFRDDMEYLKDNYEKEKQNELCYTLTKKDNKEGVE